MNSAKRSWRHPKLLCCFQTNNRDTIFSFILLSCSLLLPSSTQEQEQAKIVNWIWFLCIFKLHTFVDFVSVWFLRGFFKKYSFNYKYYFRSPQIYFFSKADTLGRSLVHALLPWFLEETSPCLCFLALSFGFFENWKLFWTESCCCPAELGPAWGGSLHPTSRPQLGAHSDV